MQFLLNRNNKRAHLGTKASLRSGEPPAPSPHLAGGRRPAGCQPLSFHFRPGHLTPRSKLINKNKETLLPQHAVSHSSPLGSGTQPGGLCGQPALRHGWRGAGQRCRACRSPADSRPSRPPAAGPSPALAAPPASSSPPSPRW